MSKTYDDDKTYDETIALIYTDDVDMVGSSESMMQEIFDVCHISSGVVVKRIQILF